MAGSTSSLPTNRDSERFSLPKDSNFRVEHRPGAIEPLFWAADIVAGAVRTARLGDDHYRYALADCALELAIDTGLGSGHV